MKTTLTTFALIAILTACDYERPPEPKHTVWVGHGIVKVGYKTDTIIDGGQFYHFDVKNNRGGMTTITINKENVNHIKTESK